MAKKYPIIATMYLFKSFNRSYNKIIYHDSGITESNRDPDFHVMVVVGTATLKRNNEVRNYFIVQNSWGEEFGYKGFMLIPMDKEVLFDFWMPAVTEDMRDLLLDIESARGERTSEFPSEEAAAKSKNTIVETTSKDSIAEIMSRSKNIDAQSWDAPLLILQHDYKLEVHALNSRQPGETFMEEIAKLGWKITQRSCWEKSFSIGYELVVCFQDGREDTLLKLTHFRRHKRKTLKKSPGKISNYPFHKPEEKHPPGKDVTKTVSNVTEQAVTIAKSAKTKKLIPRHNYKLDVHALNSRQLGEPLQYVPTITNYIQLWWVPNVVVTHEKEGIEAIHLASSRTLCKVSPGLHGHDADWNWQLLTSATWSKLPHPSGMMDSDVIPTLEPFPLHTHDFTRRRRSRSRLVICGMRFINDYGSLTTSYICLSVQGLLK